MTLQSPTRLRHLVFSILWMAGLLGLVGERPLHAAAPVASPLELARVARVAGMQDATPAARINQILASRDFTQAELFALASTHPGIVEQLVVPDQRLATDYLYTLAGADLHKIRNSGTLIRTDRIVAGKERRAVNALCAHFEVDSEKFRGVRLGPLDGRIYRLELTFQGKKKKSRFTQSMEMAWPASPTRDEVSRKRLSKHFGARPSRTGSGIGSVLPMQDGSFEQPRTLESAWRLVTGTVLGAPSPTQEVMVDTRIALDGATSVRFFATEKTRVFLKILQDVPAQAGTHIRLRAQHKTDAVRLEFQQRRNDFGITLTPVNSSGFAVGPAWFTQGRMGSHPWELLTITGVVPPGATHLRVEISAATSGTAWFDGLIIDVTNGGIR